MDIVHYVFKSFSSPYKYRDFCLLRSWTELQNGVRLIAMRSVFRYALRKSMTYLLKVIHPRVPERKDYTRAILYPTGFLIVPKDSEPHAGGDTTAKADTERKRSQLTFIAQLDRESVLLLSPDLLGETDELLVSMMNLEKVLQEDKIKDNKVKQEIPTAPRVDQQT